MALSSLKVTRNTSDQICQIKGWAQTYDASLVTATTKANKQTVISIMTNSGRVNRHVRFSLANVLFIHLYVNH